MIKLTDIKVYIRKLKLQYDKNNKPFLNCKGYTKGHIGVEENEVLARYDKSFEHFIQGKSWFSSIKIYGDIEELAKLELDYQVAQSDNVKYIKTLLSECFLKTFLITNLTTTLYCLDYKYGQRKRRVNVVTKPKPKKTAKKKSSETKVTKLSRRMASKPTTKAKVIDIDDDILVEGIDTSFDTFNDND